MESKTLYISGENNRLKSCYNYVTIVTEKTRLQLKEQIFILSEKYYKVEIKIAIFKNKKTTLLGSVWLDCWARLIFFPTPLPSLAQFPYKQGGIAT